MRRKRRNYILGFISILLFVVWLLNDSTKKEKDLQEVVKISLRDVGNELLLAINDSTSRVLPIKNIGHNKYQISFEENLSLVPNDLVESIKNSFDKSGLSNYYRVEVIQCDDQEVAYSYEVKNETESDIIPCKSRELPNQCYNVEVKFIKSQASIINNGLFLTLLILSLLALVISIFYKGKKVLVNEEIHESFATLGSFQFYPEQNKLVKKAIEISLSKKECELLEILASNANNVVKRDELTKRVWEDNGVIVGRSLDTYISKLRKKLSEDESIKITNVHGVGYKLEINK